MSAFEPRDEPIAVEIPVEHQAAFAYWLTAAKLRMVPLPSERETDLPTYELREPE